MFTIPAITDVLVAFSSVVMTIHYLAAVVKHFVA